MELDTLYIFGFETENDSTPAWKTIPSSEIMMVELAEPEDINLLGSSYYFIIEVSHKNWKIGVEFATEAADWVKAIQKARKCQLENSRSKLGKIYVNNDDIIELYRLKVTRTFTIGKSTPH